MNRVGSKTNPWLSHGGLETQVQGSNANQINRMAQRSTLNAKDKKITIDHKTLRDLKEPLNLKEKTMEYA